MAPEPRLEDDELARLERRAGAFAEATQRLSGAVGPDTTRARSRPPPAPAGGDAPFDPQSGLRPAIMPGGDDGGALTARHGQLPAGGIATGRLAASQTRAHLPSPVHAPPTAVQAATPTSTRRKPRLPRLKWSHVAIAIACLLAALLVVRVAGRRMFPVLRDGCVTSAVTFVQSPANALLAEVHVAYGAQVAAAQLLAVLELADGTRREIRSPVAGSITEISTAPRQVLADQRLFTIALPGAIMATAPLQADAIDRYQVGERFLVVGMDNGQSADGTVARVIEEGSELFTGPDQAKDPRPRIIVSLDPSPTPLQPGQGVRMVALGHRPGALRLFLFALCRPLVL